MEMNSVVCEGKCTYILNKKAYPLKTICYTNEKLAIIGKDEKYLKPGSITEKQIYACMYCDKIRNLTVLLKKPQPMSLMMVFKENETYAKTKKVLKNFVSHRPFSRQNEKIVSYASNVVEKLQQGVELLIVDAIDKNEIVSCPVCGMQCNPGDPYCMECGAEL